MKINSTLSKVTLALCLCFTFNMNFAQKRFDSAIEYLNYIGEQYKQLTDDQWSYTSAVANDKNAKVVETKRLELLRTNKSAQNKIKGMADFNGNTEYRDSVVSFLKLNYDVLNDDYENIVNMEVSYHGDILRFITACTLNASLYVIISWIFFGKLDTYKLLHTSLNLSLSTMYLV